MSVARGRSLTRLMSIVEALRAARRGLTIAQLVERTDSSRASVYRDLDVLRSAGLPLDKLPTNGEMRYVLAAVSGKSSLAATPLQFAALVTARRALSALEGTRIMRELDQLTRHVAPRPSGAIHVHVPLSRALAPERLRTIDTALEKRSCLRIRYRGASDPEPSWRVVEPVELRVSAEQPYLVAFDRASERFKTYKLARISVVQPLRERANAIDTYRPEEMFGRSRGIWSGECSDIVVRLTADVARFANEWPLHRSQTISDEHDGSVLICARVSGLQEPLRWVLSWGRNAEVLEPAELRGMVTDELTAAMNAYARRRKRQRRGVSSVETGQA